MFLFLRGSLVIFWMISLLVTNIKITNTQNIDVKTINISNIWKDGFSAFLIGLFIQLVDFILVFNSIQLDTKKEDLAPLIKTNLTFSIILVCLLVFSLANWFLVKKPDEKTI